MADTGVPEVQFLEQVGKLDVLSRPYILASDNQLATITVGQENKPASWWRLFSQTWPGVEYETPATPGAAPSRNSDQPCTAALAAISSVAQSWHEPDLVSRVNGSAPVALLEQFHWVIYLFGGFLIATGIKMFFSHADEIEPRIQSAGAEREQAPFAVPHDGDLPTLLGRILVGDANWLVALLVALIGVGTAVAVNPDTGETK